MADLSQARGLLDYEKGVKLEGSQRRYRLNYYAVTALMARVANYRGDKASARAYADEVINDCGLGLMDNGRTNPALFGETLFGLDYYNMDDRLTTFWQEGPNFESQLYLTQTRLTAIFEKTSVGNNDMRAKKGEGFFYYDENNSAISRKYIADVEQNGFIPMIRLSEMYYIMCENTDDLDEASTYFNTVRSKRGIPSSSAINFSSPEQRLSELDKEYRKDFYAEGQYWYFLKLHERETFLNCPVTSGMGKQQYVFPLPDAEKEYGWTDSMDSGKTDSDSTNEQQ